MVIKGYIENIRFRKEENGWTVAEMSPDNAADGKALVVVGLMAGLKAGMHVDVDGEYQDNSRFGRQLKASSWSESKPSDVKGIERYLSSGLIKDVGPVIAHEIVKTFGEEALDIMDNSPERLVEVKGIGKKRLESIVAAAKEQKDIRTVMVWMKRYDLPNALANRVFQKYGTESIAVIKENPYRLAEDFEGIGFKKSDQVALSVGFAEDSPLRIGAGLIHVLTEAAERGSTCLPKAVLINTAASDDVLGLDPVTVSEALDGFLGEDGDRRLVEEEGYVYLRYWHRQETKAAALLLRLVNAAEDADDGEVDMDDVEEKTGVRYEERQKEAIRLAMEHSVLVLTGGPGTGKTVTTKGIIEAFALAGKTVLLAAPTGRAAKRMTEVTGKYAQTIHRLLEWQGGFARNADYPLQGDALIVDESSMIDVALLAALLDAVPEGMKVVFVGDVDQLPSVGAGTVLRDMIGSGVIPTVRLTTIFRQAQDSDIVMGAHAVNEGRVPLIDNHKGADLWFVERAEKEDVAKTVRFLVEKHLPEVLHYQKDDIQVLTPMRRDGDIIGANELNRSLQEHLNKNTQKVVFGGTEFRLGDRVMQVKNDYTNGVFNGDIGEVTFVDPLNETLTVSFDGGDSVDYKKADLVNLDLAYATTVHKSQGSEYPVVVMPVHRSQYVMLNRNLLYTGITRAKRMCVLVGTRDALAIAATREDASKRFTLLKERLAGDMDVLEEETCKGLFNDM